uniref:EGF-like domain-containing protein n=1 Tax=Plectus sambesii TaxID=2011161 RepID=A0A914XRS0_9BILA
MRLLQALCLVVLGVSLSAAATIKCPSPMMDLIDAATKVTKTCTTDAECNAAFAGYFCADGAGGAKFCCGAPGACTKPNFIAIFENDDFKDCTACAAPAECQADMCCTAAQPAPANCNAAVEVEVAGADPPCQPKVGIKAGACMDNAQCPPGSGATCSGDMAAPGTCDCPAAMPVVVNDKCMAEATIGDPCLDTAQCVGGTCSPTTKKCECPPNNIKDAAGACVACAATEVPINNVCEKMKNLGETCPKGVAQCPAGATCNRFCLCPAGFQANGPKDCIRCDATTAVLVAGSCYPKVSYGVACIVQEQCSFASGVCTGTPGTTCQCIAGSVWDGKACKSCDAGRVIANNVCYDMSSYGAACQVNQQCTSFANGICTAGQCTCTAGNAWNGANACAACTATQVLVANQCMNKAPVGAACMYDGECAYLNGACVKNVCGCNGTMQYSGSGCGVCDGIVQNNLCYPYAAKGQPCTVDTQCTKTGGTKCIGFVCECPSGTTFNSVSCTSITDPPPATCKAGEVKVNDGCQPLLPPNGFLCYYKEQCSGGSTCVEYQCTCPAGFTTIVNSVCTGPGGVTATTPLPGAVTTPIPGAVTPTTTTTTMAPMCTGNTARIGTQCLAKTTDGVCLNVNCLSTGTAGCATYAPYQKCAYNAAQKNYFCCP